MHVPLIMQWPLRFKKNLRAQAMVELVDIAPTLLQAAGAPIYEGMQGRSFLPILTGDADAAHHRDSVFYEYYRAIPGGYRKVGHAYLTGTRTKQYAITSAHHRPEGEMDGELYDLIKDPGEVHNLWNDPASLSIKADMLKLLTDRMAQTIDPLPVTEAGY